MVKIRKTLWTNGWFGGTASTETDSVVNSMIWKDFVMIISARIFATWPFSYFTYFRQNIMTSPDLSWTFGWGDTLEHDLKSSVCWIVMSFTQTTLQTLHRSYCVLHHRYLFEQWSKTWFVALYKGLNLMEDRHFRSHHFRVPSFTIEDVCFMSPRCVLLRHLTWPIANRPVKHL